MSSETPNPIVTIGPSVAKEEPTTLERRGFLKQAMFASLAAGTTLISAKALAQSDEVFEIKTPLRSNRMIKSDHSKDNNSEEATVELEIVGSNDVKTITTTYMKRLDTERRYDVVMVTNTQYFRASQSQIPDKTISKTTSIKGEKGSIEGNTRLDTITLTVFYDGKMLTSGPTETRVLLTNPYEGMNEDEMVNAILSSKFKS